jgi:hypothetical protein
MISSKEGWWMKRLVVVVLVVGLAAAVLCLGATESLTNHSGKAASGVVLTFSESVHITSYDQTVFPNQDPTGRAETFSFSGGELQNGGRFKVTWTPSSAEILSSEWIAATTSPPAEAAGPMGFTTTTDTPTVTGEILNPAYFAHAAYVMQGVTDRDKVFAVPLLGVAELSFSPTVADIDPETATWSFEVSHPAGIGAAIENDILYIWGSNASWSGYGEVVLTGSTSDGHSGSVTIPVTVFRQDKTLIDAEGKKDYFVPWSPQLDVNRILSVEEHMRQYDKDEGELDRTIRFSVWRQAQRANDVHFSFYWANSASTQGWWDQKAQLALVDVNLWELKRLGVTRVTFENPYYVDGLSGSEVYPVYDHWAPGVSKTPLEEAYLINEAHRLGLEVAPSIFVSVELGTTADSDWRELYEVQPDAPDAFWQSLESVAQNEAALWSSTGTDIAALTNLQYILPATRANCRYIDERLGHLLNVIREAYSGPALYYGNFLGVAWGGVTTEERGFWASVDYVSASVATWPAPLTSFLRPTADQLVAGWSTWIASRLVPFEARWNKPFVPHENGCFSLAGGENWGAYFYQRSEYRSAAINLDAQAHYYEAFLRAFEQEDWFMGPNFFWYHFAENPYTGGQSDGEMTPRLKATEGVLTRWFSGEHVSFPVAVWPSAALRVADPSGDARSGGDDVVEVRAMDDGDYMQFLVQYVRSPKGGLAIWIDASGDESPEYYIGINNVVINGLPRWIGHVRRVSSWQLGDCLGVLDVAVTATRIDARLHRRFLEADARAKSILVFDHSADWSGYDDEIPGWHLVPCLGT